MHAPPFPDERENPLAFEEPEQLQGMPPGRGNSRDISSDPRVSNLATVTEATLGLAGVTLWSLLGPIVTSWHRTVWLAGVQPVTQ